MYFCKVCFLLFYFIKFAKCIWANDLFQNDDDVLIISQTKEDEEDSDTATGRVFVTIFGFPSKCEIEGTFYPCTLSLACWWVGGINTGGCGGNSWIVSCCVKRVRKNIKQDQSLLYRGDKDVKKYQIAEEPVPYLQKRNDDAEDECGLSGSRVISKRIIGGKEARFAEYPWQALLKISTFQCGGVLVSRKFVITAGHCVVKAKLKDIKVYLGELDTMDTGKVFEYEPAELHSVTRKILHPRFQYKLIQLDRFDIALLEMLTETAFSYHIFPICLPQRDLTLRGRKGIVTGWGKIKPSTEMKGTNVLRSATVPILDIEECNSWHRKKQITVELHEDVLCAGHPDGHQDACLGDSGGPLVVLENGRWVLVGITSAGFGCGEPLQPGIYHSVVTSVEWIKSVIYV
ncbi:trypsin-7 [Agrilus planipennis]|uniref:Trypsin-7 n=1 Tax=Agrilus planipennis TaxID=224129 RepID=A0A1W4XD62_AGRPL|nr:trypsin-7 [Agrilus planipennis]